MILFLSVWISWDLQISLYFQGSSLLLSFFLLLLTVVGQALAHRGDSGVMWFPVILTCTSRAIYIPLLPSSLFLGSQHPGYLPSYFCPSSPSCQECLLHTLHQSTSTQLSWLGGCSAHSHKGNGQLGTAWGTAIWE